MLTQHLPQGFACVACTRPTWKTVCEPCKVSLQWNQEFMPSPISELEAIAPLLFSYSRSQLLIRRFKENGGTDLKRALFRMPQALKNRMLETHFFAVVPIPQDPDRSLRRGHESATVTARYFADQLSIPLLSLLSLRTANTKRVTGLAKFEREWVENPFVFSEEISSQIAFSWFKEKVNQGKEIRILLVDDLITSGSTLAKASETLKVYYPDLKIWGGSIGFRPHRKFI